jgi:NAD(P)-dependent dehydrogenase (short-subunit alcohol dehydrogenase family)
MKLEGKVAVITGGTSGIGRATAILFGQEGSRVVVVGRRQEEGDKTVDLMRDKGAEAVFVRADVSQPQDVKEMIKRAINEYERIDILFNNAGINPESARKPMAECSEEDWDRIMDINVKGMFLVSKAAIPEMIKQGGGAIINTASILAQVSSKNRAIYGTSKGAVVALTRGMALDYAPFTIRVNCILPGLVETEMAQELIRSAQQDPRQWECLMCRLPIGRTGKPEDIAHLVLFLASDESNWITGSLITVDGGYTAQ